MISQQLLAVARADLNTLNIPLVAAGIYLGSTVQSAEAQLLPAQVQDITLAETLRVLVDHTPALARLQTSLHAVHSKLQPLEHLVSYINDRQASLVSDLHNHMRPTISQLSSKLPTSSLSPVILSFKSLGSNVAGRVPQSLHLEAAFARYKPLLAKVLMPEVLPKESACSEWLSWLTMLLRRRASQTPSISHITDLRFRWACKLDASLVPPRQTVGQMKWSQLFNANIEVPAYLMLLLGSMILRPVVDHFLFSRLPRRARRTAQISVNVLQVAGILTYLLDFSEYNASLPVSMWALAAVATMAMVAFCTAQWNHIVMALSSIIFSLWTVVTLPVRLTVRAANLFKPADIAEHQIWTDQTEVPTAGDGSESHADDAKLYEELETCFDVSENADEGLEFFCDALEQPPLEISDSNHPIHLARSSLLVAQEQVIQCRVEMESANMESDEAAEKFLQASMQLDEFKSADGPSSRDLIQVRQGRRRFRHGFRRRKVTLPSLHELMDATGIAEQRVKEAKERLLSSSIHYEECVVELEKAVIKATPLVDCR